MTEPRQTNNRTTTQTQTVSVGDEPIIDVKAAGYFLGFLGRSIRRRRRLMTTTFLVTAGLSTALALVMPRVYKINTRILTHKSLVMPALVDPDRSIPQAADAPTSGAVELIKSRDNLENLMADIKLQEVWDTKRSILWKTKDKILGLLGKPTKQDVHEAFLKMLDERIVATVDNEVVIMDVEWPDPDIAMSLAEGSLARFLKLRHDMELSEILSTVAILERNVENSRKGIEDAVSRMQKVFNEKERELEGRSAASTGERRRARKNRVVAIRRPLGPDHADPAGDDLRRALADKQAAIEALKRGYESRLKRAQEELANLRSTLGPDHPDVQDAKRTLDSMNQAPPELVALQAEEARLASQLSSMPSNGNKEEPKVQVQTEREAQSDDSFDVMRVPVSEELYQDLGKDPEITSVMEELKKRQDAHDSLLRRLANARIESETANVAFEYRYIPTVPPVYPKKYVKPNIPVMIGGGMFLGLLLGVVFAVVADVMSKRVLEAWQLERFLNLKVLGELEDP